MKIKLKSMGVSEGGPSIAKESVVDKKRYPSFQVNSDQIEGLGDMKMGTCVYIIAECEIQEITKGKNWGSEEGFRANLTIKKAALKVDDEDEAPKSISDAFHRAAAEVRE
jgi:hypothetical protein